jgi:hypothetical protein
VTVIHVLSQKRAFFCALALRNSPLLLQRFGLKPIIYKRSEA